MSKIFKLINRETREIFKGTKDRFPVLYDSGYAAFVSTDGFYTYVTPVDTKIWEVVLRRTK